MWSQKIKSSNKLESAMKCKFARVQTKTLNKKPLIWKGSAYLVCS